MSIVPLLGSIFSRRTNTSVGLVKSVLDASPLQRFNPGWVSYSTGANPSSAYKALEDGSFEESEYLKYALSLSDDPEDVLIFDETHIEKTKSKTSEDRNLSVKCTGYRQFRKLIVWTILYSVLKSANSDPEDSWCIPLTVDDSGLGKDVVSLVAERIKLIRSMRENGFTVLLDAGFNIHAIATKLEEADIYDVTLIARRSIVSVFYRPGVTTKIDKETHIKARSDSGDYSYNQDHPYYGKTTLEEHLGVTQSVKNNVLGNAYYFKCSRIGRKIGSVEMVVFLTGGTGERIDAHRVIYSYMQRFTIEHHFRFLKMHFGLLDYKCQNKTTLLQWVRTLMCAYLELYTSKTMTLSKLPYWLENRYKNKSATPFMVWLCYNRSVSDSAFAKYNVITRPGGKGWPKGKVRKRRMKPRVVTRQSLNTSPKTDNQPRVCLPKGFKEEVEANPRYYELV